MEGWREGRKGEGRKGGREGGRETFQADASDTLNKDGEDEGGLVTGPSRSSHLFAVGNPELVKCDLAQGFPLFRAPSLPSPLPPSLPIFLRPFHQPVLLALRSRQRTPADHQREQSEDSNFVIAAVIATHLSLLPFPLPSFLPSLPRLLPPCFRLLQG
jgi:hypothetical protein